MVPLRLGVLSNDTLPRPSAPFSFSADSCLFNPNRSAVRRQTQHTTVMVLSRFSTDQFSVSAVMRRAFCLRRPQAQKLRVSLFDLIYPYIAIQRMGTRARNL